MNKKTIITIVITLVVGLILGYAGANIGGNLVKGATNLDTLELSGDLSVAGASTFTGTSTFSGRAAFQKLQSTGVYSTSTSAAAGTLTAAQLAYPVIFVTPTGANLTVTLPASSTVTNFVTTAGDSAKVLVYNASSAATTTTIAAGTGMTLIKASSTAAIPAGGTGIINLLRKTNTDIVVSLDINQ